MANTDNLGRAMDTAAAREVGRFMAADTAKCIDGLRSGQNQTDRTTDETAKKVRETTD